MIKKEYPPNYDQISKTFKLSGREIFAYDGVIYSPHTIMIPPELVAHEKVHFKQQSLIGVEIWWDLYLKDAQFRLDQELEAHQVEYKTFKQITKDRNEIAKYLHSIAARLSSEMYGKIITQAQAIRLINGN